MNTVVFVAPYFAETTLGFVDAVARLEAVRTVLVTEDDPARLPTGLRERLAAVLRVDDALDADRLIEAVGAVAERAGGLRRLLGTLEELQVPLALVRDRLGIDGMGAEAAINFRDKARMKRVLSEHGLPCARHAVAASDEDVTAFCRLVDFPVICKPRAGSGSRGTHRIDGPEQLASLLRAMPPTTEHPLYLEEFITGDEHSFDSVMLGGRLAWFSVNDYSPAPLEVVREPWIQWCVVTPRDVDAPEYRAIRDVAGDALRALGLQSGFSHMEWFRRPDETVVISEVGARPPGARFTNLISHAGGFDFSGAWARLMVFDEFEPRPRPYAAGAAYLRGQGRGKVARVRGLDDVLAELGDLVVEVRRPGPGQSPSGTYEGEGYVILRHPETEVVRQALWRVVETVRVELEG